MKEKHLRQDPGPKISRQALFRAPGRKSQMNGDPLIFMLPVMKLFIMVKDIKQNGGLRIISREVRVSGN